MSASSIAVARPFDARCWAYAVVFPSKHSKRGSMGSAICAEAWRGFRGRRVLGFLCPVQSSCYVEE